MRTRATLGAYAALGALVAAAPGAVAAQLQATVHAVSLEADLASTPGVVMVHIEYVLNDVEPGALVPVSLVDFGDAVADGFRVGTSGARGELPARHGAARSGRWPVEAGPDGRAVLSVAYRVPRNGESGDGRIVSHLPVLSVDRAPEAARPGLFRGRVRVPADWRVTEGFPTGLAAGDGAGRFDVELPVVPAVVTLRARSDGRGGLALPMALDLVALAALMVTAAAGWRHMREPVP